jgi:hypothetical protein
MCLASGRFYSDLVQAQIPPHNHSPLSDGRIIFYRHTKDESTIGSQIVPPLMD